MQKSTKPRYAIVSKAYGSDEIHRIYIKTQNTSKYVASFMTYEAAEEFIKYAKKNRFGEKS